MVTGFTALLLWFQWRKDLLTVANGTGKQRFSYNWAISFTNGSNIYGISKIWTRVTHIVQHDWGTTYHGGYAVQENTAYDMSISAIIIGYIES